MTERGCADFDEKIFSFGRRDWNCLDLVAFTTLEKESIRGKAGEDTSTIRAACILDGVPIFCSREGEVTDGRVLRGSTMWGYEFEYNCGGAAS